MKRWRVLTVVVAALVLSLVLAVPAFAAVVDVPTADYLTGTTKIAIPGPSNASYIEDANLRVTFNETYFTTLPSILWQWGDAGRVEDTFSPGMVLMDSNPNASWTLSKSATTFGFEASTNLPDRPIVTTVTFKHGTEIVGSVTKTLTWASGVRNLKSELFAVKSDVPFDGVQIAVTGFTGGQQLLIGQVRYALGTPVTVNIGSKYGDSVLDTYLISKSPVGTLAKSTANFVGMTARDEERTLISFPLSKLADTSVTSATLSMTRSTGSLSLPVLAYRLRRPVTAHAAWHEYDTGAAWGADGAKSPTEDYFAEVSAAGSNGTFQVGDLLKAAIADGEDSLDIIIVDPDPVSRIYMGFYSSDCVYSDWRPKLTVDGVVGAP